MSLRYGFFQIFESSIQKITPLSLTVLSDFISPGFRTLKVKTKSVSQDWNKWKLQSNLHQISREWVVTYVIYAGNKYYLWFPFLIIFHNACLIKGVGYYYLTCQWWIVYKRTAIEGDESNKYLYTSTYTTSVIYPDPSVNEYVNLSEFSTCLSLK